MRIPGLAAGLLAALTTIGNTQELLVNVNTLPDGAGHDSNPEDFVELEGRLYFSATTLESGREYWWMASAGDEPKLLADIVPGAQGSNPEGIVALGGGVCLFRAWTPELGEELWRTDGTPEGTLLVRDIRPGPESASLSEIVVKDGYAYFLASTDGASRGLWRTNGTYMGTTEVDALPADADYYLTQWEGLEVFGDKLFVLTARRVASVPHWQLLATDGGWGHAQVLAERTYLEGEWLHPPVALPSGVLFAAPEFGAGSEPWFSDGTVAGTAMVNDLFPGPIGSRPLDLTQFQGRVFFSADHPLSGRELVASDGTVAGTLIMTDVATAEVSSSPEQLAVAEGRLYFSAFGIGVGREVWVTDGVPGDWQLVADLQVGPGSSYPGEFCGLDGRVLMRAQTNGTGSELWAVDAQGGNSAQAIDIETGSIGSLPTDLAVFDSRIVCAASASGTGREPWFVEPSLLSPPAPVDLAGSGLDQSSNPRQFISLGDIAVFFADDGFEGCSLWRTDGTAEGTWPIAALEPAPVPVSALSSLKVGHQAYFAARGSDGVPQLWITDGTAEGTRPVSHPELGPLADPALIAIFDGELYLAAREGPIGRELFATDGTDSGTRFVADIQPGFLPSEPGGGAVAGGRLYFTAWDLTYGRELWSTDGTEQGTVRVTDVAPGSASGVDPTDIVQHEGAIIFRGFATYDDEQVWRYDPGTGQAQALSQFQPGDPHQPGDFYSVGSRLIFHASPAIGETQLFALEGTQVTQLTFPPYKAGQALVGNGTDVFNVGSDGTDGGLLIATDGTPAGTRTVQVFSPGKTWIAPSAMFRVTSGDAVVLSATNENSIQRLWRTDGTWAGTTWVGEPVGKLATPVIDQLCRVGDRLIVGFDSATAGREPHVLDLAPVDDWVAEPFGGGCGELTLKGLAPAAVGASFKVELVGAEPASASLLALSTDFAAWSPAGTGCTVHLGSAFALQPGLSDPSGIAVHELPIPDVPSLAGLELWLQAWATEPFGPFAGAFTVSPALEVVLGD